MNDKLLAKVCLKMLRATSGPFDRVIVSCEKDGALWVSDGCAAFRVDRLPDLPGLTRWPAPGKAIKLSFRRDPEEINTPMPLVLAWADSPRCKSVTITHWRFDTEDNGLGVVFTNAAGTVPELARVDYASILGTTINPDAYYNAQWAKVDKGGPFIAYPPGATVIVPIALIMPLTTGCNNPVGQLPTDAPAFAIAGGDHA